MQLYPWINSSFFLRCRHFLQVKKISFNKTKSVCKLVTYLPDEIPVIRISFWNSKNWRNTQLTKGVVKQRLRISSQNGFLSTFSDWNLSLKLPAYFLSHFSYFHLSWISLFRFSFLFFIYSFILFFIFLGGFHCELLSNQRIIHNNVIHMYVMVVLVAKNFFKRQRHN